MQLILSTPIFKLHSSPLFSCSLAISVTMSIIEIPESPNNKRGLEIADSCNLEEAVGRKKRRHIIEDSSEGEETEEAQPTEKTTKEERDKQEKYENEKNYKDEEREKEKQKEEAKINKEEEEATGNKIAEREVEIEKGEEGKKDAKQKENTKPKEKDHQKQRPKPQEGYLPFPRCRYLDDMAEEVSADYEEDNEENDEDDDQKEEPLVEYDVARIVGYNNVKNKHFFKVHWRGYRTAEDTWEPLDHLLPNSAQKLKNFFRRCNRLNKRLFFTEP